MLFTCVVNAHLCRYCLPGLFRYESAFSLKPEERYTAGLGRKSSWDTMTDNTVEDISTSYSDTSSEKYVWTGSHVLEFSHACSLCCCHICMVIIIFLSLMYLKWIGLSKVQRPTRHILGHFRDGGVTAASARIVAAVRAHSVRGVV